jgi:hypothetical protein
LSASKDQLLLRRTRAAVVAGAATPCAAPETVALVGASHAPQWRGAVEVVAAAKPSRRLRRPSRCPFLDASRGAGAGHAAGRRT